MAALDPVNNSEWEIQKAVIRLFREELGYHYLGNWKERKGNANVEVDLLRGWLLEQGHALVVADRAVERLVQEASTAQPSLMAANQQVYGRLRYGIDVQLAVGERVRTVPVVDWAQPERNHWAIAEEVSLPGAEYGRRPDLVIYLNGIAVAVIELKRGTVSVGDSIRQLLSLQDARFVTDFFTTVQFCFGGNVSQGLRYGTVGTPEKYYLQWKEDEEDDSRNRLEKYLLRMCRKERLADLMYHFVLFDGGVKKVPRVQQYFGVKAAQNYIVRRQGGIIWHTQGSGKSITMVMLAKWILEQNPQARVAVVTDREELDEQIEGVFKDTGEEIYRTKSGRDLLAKLSEPSPRLLCSLIQKFNARHAQDVESFLESMKGQPTATVGEVFVFVDEAHRSQSGRLHKYMQAYLPHAVFVGFTGTPLLKEDKATTLEVFGTYMHTYKYGEAVADGVVLDLLYEARHIAQQVGDPHRIDRWFERVTRHANDYQKALLKKHWGTLRHLHSSAERMRQIVLDIQEDFLLRPRLANGRGNAMLVASSIYDACRYYELFESTPLRGHVGLVTSYSPQARHLTTEETGANTDTDKQFMYQLYTGLVAKEAKVKGKTSEEVYEARMKEEFVHRPKQRKLLIVVSKLLTGFDAPSCSVLYLDKQMRDHGLFQAICRVNRLDGEDKQYGEVIDYCNQLRSVEGAMSVYTSELEVEGLDAEAVAVRVQERVATQREQLDRMREQYRLLVAEVAAPRDDHAYIRYFCGNTDLPQDHARTEERRIALYMAVARYTRAYMQLQDGMLGAGYSAPEKEDIVQEVGQAIQVRQLIKQASGETIDLKSYEADMRYLIDHYIRAEGSVVVSTLNDLPLLEVIAQEGMSAAINRLGKSLGRKKEVVVEVIENNVRSVILRKQQLNPAYYASMSKLLQDLLLRRQQDALNYEEYLRELEALARDVRAGHDADTPEALNTEGKRALYEVLDQDEALTVKVDATVRQVKKAEWRKPQDGPKEREIMAALYQLLQDEARVYAVMEVLRGHPEW